MEKEFQIEYNYGGSSRSYEYFTASENYEKSAAEKATESLQKTRSRDNDVRSIDVFSALKGPYKAPKTLSVFEWDNEAKARKRGGQKFKIKLCYIKTKYKGGHTVTQEWYEPETIL